MDKALHGEALPHREPCVLSDTETETEIEVEAPALLPLDVWHRAKGARMVPFAGYEMPIQYDGIVAEHNWTRTAAGLFDVSHMGQLTVSGEGAVKALEALMPGDFSELSAGRMRYSLLLNADGGILDDLIVTHAGDHFALVVNGAMKWDDIAHLREFLPDEITLNHHADQALLALQGPEAARVLERIVPGTSALTFMTAATFDWDSTTLGVSRSGYTGEDGFELSLHTDAVERFANAILEDERVRPAGLGARDSLRLEAGLPLYGHDLSQSTDPVSAGLTFALSKARRERGGWMGHEAVAKVLSHGPAQKRIGLTLEGRQPAREGAQVFAGDTAVGQLTSGGHSPTLGYPIAMAYVDAAHTAIDTALEIEVRGKRLPARVTKMPIVPHRYFRGK